MKTYRTIKWGDPLSADDLDVGSTIGRAQADKVEQMVNTALENKAELVAGGRRPADNGAYFEPTVIANPDQRSEIVQEEVFGPVVTIQRNDHFTRTSETPHGGVKESGWGKDGSKYALDDYTVVKHVAVNTAI